MNLLLDTHIWIWLATGDERLSKRLRSLIRKDSTSLWLSPISVWEVTMLCRKGRLELLPSPQKWIEKSIEMLSLKEARFTFKVGMLADQLEWENRDPADRIIAATAIEARLKLATEDSRMFELEKLEFA